MTGRGWPGQPGFVPGNGVLFLALSIESFQSTEAFLIEGAALREQVKATPPASGFDQVLLPGEPEQHTAERRWAEGISVDEATWTQLTAAAEALGVAVPED